ncbi:MAG: isochorismatase family protein [Candidatus Thorarchaeota archaeon]
MEKESYFTHANRKEKIEEWKSITRDIKSRKPFELRINRAALLVLDMQNYFIDRNSHAHIPSAGTIILPINNLISFMHEKRRPIIFTRHITSSEPDDLMKKMWKDIITEEDQISEIITHIDSSKGIVITKNYYSAFRKTGLNKLLKELGVEQLIITGVMTHLCCETTTRDAFARYFEVFFVMDGTATYTEDLHVGTLRAISHGFGVCMTVEEIMSGE